MACSQFPQDKKAEKQMSCPTQNTAALNHTKNIELKKKPFLLEAGGIGISVFALTLCEIVNIVGTKTSASVC